MKTEDIAKVCHEVNRAYCRAIGDDSQVAWESAEKWQKDSAVMGVELHLNNPDAGPSASHDSWMAQKIADGWVYGEEKDPELKLHPCLVPYEDLPTEQKAKDYIFAAVVKAIASIPAEKPLIKKVGFTPVKYIGKRETYKDGCYESGGEWERGQTLMIQSDKAKLLLNHPDVYALGEETGETGIEANETKPGDQEEVLQSARDFVNAMPRKQALAEYAKRNFNIEIAEGKLHEMKAQVISLIDKFGIE